VRYRWLLFDADGTLFDYDLAESTALEKTFKQIGRGFEPRYVGLYRQINEKIWQEYERGEISQALLRTRRFRLLFEAIGFDANPEIFSEVYLQNFAACSDLIEDAEDTVKALSGKVGMVLITNGLTTVQRPRLARSAIGGYFADIVISDEVGVAKPDRRIFDIAFGRMNHPRKDEVLIIGDSLTSDMKGGNDYGIDTCWFNPLHRPCDGHVTVRYEIDRLPDILRIIGDGERN